jgi:hypothetical protein
MSANIYLPSGRVNESSVVRSPELMSENFYDAIWLIADAYAGDASKNSVRPDIEG